MLGIGGDPVWEMLRWMPDFGKKLSGHRAQGRPRATPRPMLAFSNRTPVVRLPLAPACSRAT